ncbi:MAG: MFS transporter [Candidatus Binataceae bacterium]
MKRAGIEAAAQPAAPAGPAPRIYGADFWFVFAATFALNMAINLFVLFPLFIVGLGGGASVIGMIAALGSAAALLCRPGLPLAIDRIGRKQIAIWSMVLDAIAIALYAPLQALRWPIYAVRALNGAAEGTARVALFAMLFSVLPQERHSEGMALFSVNGMIPAALAPMLGEEIIKRFGFTAFFITAVAFLLIGAAMMGMVANDPESEPSTARRNSAGPEAVPSYRDLIFSPALAPLWIVTLLFSIAVMSRLNFVAPFAYQKGITRVAWYFFFYASAAVTLRLLGGRLMDRFGAIRILPPSLLIVGAGIALVAGTGEPGMLNLAAVVGGLGHGLTYPALSLLVIRRTTPSAMGHASTVYTSLYDLGAMIGPYALGVIASFIGYAPMFVIAGSCAIAAGLYLIAAEPAAISRRIA